MSSCTLRPSRVTVMIKPVGALCNLQCGYCYYLPTRHDVYAGREHRMTRQTLESIFASVLPRFDDQVTIAWQGGEPTLAGRAFFEDALGYQRQYARPGQQVCHALQTNGTLLDEPWCRFLRDHRFLVGLSIDGPPHLHDAYRITARGRPSSPDVRRAVSLLQRYGVEYNILTVLNDVTVRHPDEVLAYLLNLGARWLQFIPAVEWQQTAAGDAPALAPFTPDAQAYGRFLCRIFDLWFTRYRNAVSVRDIDAMLNQLVLGEMPLCTFAGACHNQLTIEHDGSIFGCDHFVQPRWRLGRIGQPGWQNALPADRPAGVSEPAALSLYGRPLHHLPGDGDDDRGGGTRDAPCADAETLDSGWFDRIDTPRLATFAARKQALPAACLTCEYRRFCHGGCPKHRPSGGDLPEPTVLCAGYRALFAHAMPRLEWLAGYLRRNIMPPEPQGHASTPRHASPSSRPRGRPARNEPCPCGSGLKFKRCHGRG